MSETDKLKEQYNKLLKRYDKAVIWLDTPERTVEEINKHYSQYEKLLKDINSLISELGIQGDRDRILYGFRE